MRKMRLPVSLNEATCTITDKVSTTNTPHMMKRIISCRTITATTPSAAPKASAPTSPMKTSAGYALNHKNASPAPAIAAQKTASSPAPGICGRPRYFENTALPATYAKIASALATITVGKIARPSRPSVRLTALLEPTITKYVSAINPAIDKGTVACFKKGIIKPVCSGKLAELARYPATAKPITDCQKYFQRDGRPFAFFSTTLRQSSTQPIAPNPTSVASASQT